MKHIFIVIELRSGEDEFDQKVVLEIGKRKNVDKFANQYVKEFWGNSTDFGDGWVEYPNGIIGRLKRVEVISEEDYNVLKRFI